MKTNEPQTEEISTAAIPKVNVAETEKKCDKNLNRGPGGKLRKAREKMQLTAEQIAHHLHLPKSTINSIESDNYSGATEHTYIRGYLRSYARIVGIAPDEVINEFNHLECVKKNGVEKITDKSAIVIRGKQKADTLIYWISTILVLSLITLGLIWWQTQKAAHRTHPQLLTQINRTSSKTEPPSNSLQDFNNPTTLENSATVNPSALDSTKEQTDG